MNWQFQLEKRWISKLLANKWVVKLILKFLKDIKINIRKEIREKKLKQQKKNN